MYKEYPSSRVCAIDYHPVLLGAMKDMYNFCKKNSIPLKSSKDLQRFFYHYCLDRFCDAYKKCKSPYPKAIVVYPSRKNANLNPFFLDKVLKVLPVPWTKCSSFDSPDVEVAVLGAVSKNRSVSSKLNAFANKHKLLQFLKKNQKIKTFSAGTVDLSRETE